VAAKEVHTPVELAEHRVDVPEAVAEHDFVRGLAEPRAVPLGVAQQPRRVEQLPPDLARTLLRPLAPLAGQIDPLLDLQTRPHDRRFGAGGIGASRHDPERSPQPFALARLEAVGGERLVDERPAAGAQHPAKFPVGALEIGDVLEDAATPDEIGAPVFRRERLGGSAHEADPSCPGRDLHGVDPDDGEAEALCEPERVLAVAAPDVDDERTLRQPEVLHEVVEELRTSRSQALVEGRAESILDPEELVVRLLEPAAHSGSKPLR
jgi:hypothetical protein